MLGEGGFSIAYKARNDEGRLRAVKILKVQNGRTDPVRKDSFVKEYEKAKELDHKHIVKYYDLK